MSLDVAIRKSLLDKNEDSLVYNPNIVINENTKNIKDRIKTLLNKSSRIDIAVSYIVWSGLSLIYDDLKRFDKNSRLILTTEGLVTDPISLRKLKELNMQVKVYVPSIDRNDKGFHLKTFMFEDNDNVTLLIGSSNISARAFGMVHEMAVEIDASSKGYIVEKYNNVFNDLWNNTSSIHLDTNFISGYTEIFKHKTKYIFNNTFFTNDIKPNYMQIKALESLEECRKYSDKGLVIAATGTGKTYLSAFDVLNSKARKVLFLVHNRLILTSAISTFKKVFKNKHIIELKINNIDEIYSSDLIFTTDKTAYNHLYNKISRTYFDYIIYDEAHKIGLDTKYMELIEYFEPKFTLGITATPERTDNPDYLFKTFKYNIPYEIRLLEAMNNELVCPFTYYGLNLTNKLLKSNEEFNYDELSLFLKEKIEEKGHYGEKLKCIIFCSDIKEAKTLSDTLNNIGFKSTTAVSDDKNNTREQIEEYIEELKSDNENTLEIICTVNKFNEGVDIPDINVIIMLRSTTSSIIYLQQLGRGLRRTNDPHKYVTIFDIIGNSKNNYSIAQALTGNTTVDKRKLYMYANKQFETVSPFINVEIEKEAMEKIIKSISNNFTIKTKLKEKFKDELYRFKEIPTLLEMYLNPNFKELELVQLLHKNFYDPFEEYYCKKYNINKTNQFLKNFFTLISQFVFRAYDNNTLRDYVSLLKGKSINNDILKRVLLTKDELKNYISSAIKSDYNKEGKNFIKPFILKSNLLILNDEILKELEKLNALELFNEHIDLFKHISNQSDNYRMKPFDLVDKAEFLFNVGSDDCYMAAIGEKINHEKKSVYCPITVVNKPTLHDNYIIDNDKIVYYTMSTDTKQKAIEKINLLINNNYKFYICAQFPHLGYSNTSYFNLGNVSINSISDVKLTNKGKYNHEIVLKLENEIPIELLQYKENN